MIILKILIKLFKEVKLFGGDIIIVWFSMSEELHLEALNALCRVCARPVKRHPAVYECQKYTVIMRSVFKIDVSNDDVTVQPVHFCHCCYRTIERAVVADEKMKIFTHSVKAHTVGETPYIRVFAITCKK